MRPRVCSPQLVVGDEALHECQDGFVDRHVDDLARPGLVDRCGPVPFPVQQRHHDAEGGEDPGQGVAEADPDPGRRHVGRPGDVADAAHGLADAAEAGPLRRTGPSGRSR